ncbi:MAG: xanthine dehydrogenase family protein subunit M [Acidobacteriia bacterium]|nr:xanthine dehydrogenase family protein subunit M [Terriglobia bacterium]
MRSFEYLRPTSLDEAVKLMAKHGRKARVLAGGQSLLNMMKLRIASPEYLVDLCELDELTTAEADSRQGLRIGAMVTYHQLQKSGLLNSAYGMVGDALEVIADEQVRHVGTLGGSCCQADPHGDTPNVVVALEAEMEAVSSKGRRLIRAGKFFAGLLETALASDEILVNIRLPQQPASTGSAYEKFAWRKGDYAIISAASLITLGNGGQCARASMVIGSARSSPLVLGRAPSVLVDKKVTPEVIAKAAEAAFEEVEPEADAIYGSSEYKKELVRTLAERSLLSAWKRTQRGIN